MIAANSPPRSATRAPASPSGGHSPRSARRATPAAARKRLQNVRSEIAFALDRYGLGGRRSYLAPLSPEAQALYHRLPTKYFHCALSRFLHFISAQGIPPDRVTDAVSRQFLTALERHSSIKNPRETHKNMCRVWNKAHADVPGWPDVVLTEPCYRRAYGLRWSEFPASLGAAVDAFFADPVDDGDFFAHTGRQKPLAPRTIATQKDHLRCAASALVRTGHDPNAIVDLEYVVRPAHVAKRCRTAASRFGKYCANRTRWSGRRRAAAPPW